MLIQTLYSPPAAAPSGGTIMVDPHVQGRLEASVLLKKVKSHGLHGMKRTPDISARGAAGSRDIWVEYTVTAVRISTVSGAPKFRWDRRRVLG